MIDRKGWEEFREKGLLWWINVQLHMFGYALCYDYDDEGNLVEVYPARVGFRGFDMESTSEGYEKVSGYLKDNITKLHEESQDR